MSRWGPEVIDGGARFRLWAPAAKRVALGAGPARRLSMRPEANGWWTLETDAVPPGGSYGFVIDEARFVPDPASRAQVMDVHGASRLPQPGEHAWQVDWQGRPWEEAVLYELHVGTFTPAGDLLAAMEKLPHLAALGVTAVQLMPVAQFAGRRGWGYDGTLLFAPHRAYGGPVALKRFVDAAHGLGMMVLLDVVYNHFGPEGNYLPLYAPDFFDPARQTPWGAAIAYDTQPVRDFFTQNAAWWIGEFRLDGLRLDAIDQIRDGTILDEIARAARAAGAGRPVHLTTEDNRNITTLHRRDGEGRVRLYTAEWNDDFHHVAHVAATGETVGYYADYAEDHAARMARVMGSGFDYQGAHSVHLGRARGEPSSDLPPLAFIDFLQNHDQVGNRATGERIDVLAPPRTVETLTAILLLSPHVPLLFMGQEWAETNPFLFFADFGGALAAAVRDGRRSEFAYWPAFGNEAARETIPDPSETATFEASRIDWRRATGAGEQRMTLIGGLLATRRAEIVPRLAGMRHGGGAGDVLSKTVFAMRWTLGDGATLRLLANIGSTATCAPTLPEDARVLHETEPGLARRLADAPLPGWSCIWSLEA